MSIEEKAIKTLNEIIDEGWLISDTEKCTAIDACKFAIDRIRKYQKIEQIANDKNINGDLLRMSEIRWVLENGNDDL